MASERALPMPFPPVLKVRVLRGPRIYGETEASWRYCKVLTWSSNFLATGPAVVLAGDLVTAVLTASYGGYMTAILETWRLTTQDEWMALGATPLPNPRADIDFNSATVGGLPVLGGSGFYYEGEAWILGVRMGPPPSDPHISHAERKEKKEKEEDDPDSKSDQGGERNRKGVKTAGALWPDTPASLVTGVVVGEDVGR